MPTIRQTPGGEALQESTFYTLQTPSGHALNANTADITGNATLAQAAQFLSASGSVAISAVATITQRVQTLAAAGSVAIAATLVKWQVPQYLLTLLRLPATIEIDETRKGTTSIQETGSTITAGETRKGTVTITEGP